MSKYTTELRFVCETASGLDESKGYNDVNQVLEACHSKIFNFDYPIFDETYRPVLEKKILKHYYTREIGSETVGRWKLWLDARMNEIMPYYNLLYKSALLEFDPFKDADYTKSGNKTLDDDRTHNDTTTHNTQDKTTGTVADNTNLKNVRTDNLTRNDADAPKNDHWDYYNDTPQGGLSGIQGNTYLTDVRHITDDGTGSTRVIKDTGTQENQATGGNTRTYNTQNAKTGTVGDTGTATIDSTEEYAEHVLGKFPGTSYSKMLKEFRETFINIDMMIIRDLNDLFMMLW